MSRALNLLLLAGSAEAREIAERLADSGHRIAALLSEPARGPGALALPARLLPDPTPQNVEAALAGFDAVLDASHGFDGALSRAGYAAAQACDLPFLSLQRPDWDASENPNWQSAPDVAAARALVAPGARVFAATGWASLEDFLPFPGAKLLLRQTRQQEHRKPPADCIEPVFSAPPFTVTGEKALFASLAIDTLICRNIGGSASRPKLDAAAALGLRVILIARPKRPDMPSVASIAEALDWLETL